MKKILIHSIIISLALIGSLEAQGSDTTMTIDFQVTTTSPGGNYSPRNIGAIWVEDANGAFVKTLKVWANRRIQYLYTWQSRTGGNTVDGVTGATYSSHNTRTVSWDFTDVSGDTVPAGDYTLRLELTDQHSQGPLYAFDFPFMGSVETITPPDQSYFHNMQLSYDVTIVVGTDSEAFESPGVHILKSNYPNPFNPGTRIPYVLGESTSVSLAVYDIQGHLIRQLVKKEQGAGSYWIDWDGRDYKDQLASAGVYICVLQTGYQVQTLKMVNLK